MRIIKKLARWVFYGFLGVSVLTFVLFVIFLITEDTSVENTTQPDSSKEITNATVVTQNPSITETPKPTQTPAPTNTPKPPTPTPFPTATIEPAPSYKEIQKIEETSTEAQLKAYAEQLVGKSIVGWEGWVCDVTEIFGTYTVEVAMTEKHRDNIFNCVSVVDFKTSKAKSVQFNIGDHLTFSGVIESTSTGLLGEMIFIDLTEVSYEFVDKP